MCCLLYLATGFNFFVKIVMPVNYITPYVLKGFKLRNSLF